MSLSFSPPLSGHFPRFTRHAELPSFFSPNPWPFLDRIKLSPLALLGPLADPPFFCYVACVPFSFTGGSFRPCTLCEDRASPLVRPPPFFPVRCPSFFFPRTPRQLLPGSFLAVFFFFVKRIFPPFLIRGARTSSKERRQCLRRAEPASPWRECFFSGSFFKECKIPFCTPFQIEFKSLIPFCVFLCSYM